VTKYGSYLAVATAFLPYLFFMSAKPGWFQAMYRAVVLGLMGS
jgi:hypothetical protein